MNIHSSTVLVTKKSGFYLDYLSTMHRVSELRCTMEYKLRLHINTDECHSNAGNRSKSQNIPIDLLALKVKNLPATQETQLQLLGWEAPLEKGMQPTPVFLENPMDREACNWQATVLEVAMSWTQVRDFHIHAYIHTWNIYIG